MEPDQRAKIAASRRVSNPGCWPTGFLALVRPLVRAGLIPGDFPLTVTGVSGYSGGGKSMIEEFEATDSPRHVVTVVRTYGLALAHKHLPEMRIHAGIAHAPVFSPNVGRFYRGMIVEVPLQLWALAKRPKVYDLFAVLREAYRGEKLIEVDDLENIPFFKEGAPDIDKAMSPPPTSIDAEMLKHTNGMKLFVLGNDKTEQARLIAVLDNLGKGASGAAVQNLNIMCGLPETTGLV
jgi:N-acetyl-gamma-glutamyl-phosphate reductase